jgi:6-phosphogluconolactonase (cycloisomerase 2 family)
MAVVLGMSACGGYTVGFLWVLGTQYNQIAGFKIDDFTGNLTSMVNSPYTSGGSDPVSIAVRVGGNFVFVVNKGTGHGDGNVAVFAVGEDGILTFQNAYSTAGNSPVWVSTDSTGSFLYVLDSLAPDGSGNGDITVFAIDGTTGRLQLVPNQLIKNAQGQQLNYFEVGKAPSILRAGGSCVYTLDTGDQTIYSYGVGSGGQLEVEPFTSPTSAVNATSLNVNGNNIYIVDAGTVATPENRILPFSPGANCSISPQADGAALNLPTSSDPVYSLVDSKSKYLYVLNHSTTSTNSGTTNSSISAFVIESTGQLQPISDIDNPYPVGNGPVCMVEDPSNQYLYTSNMNDGTVTGKFINQNTGQLSDLTRGSSFPATGLATCLAVSGNVD